MTSFRTGMAEWTRSCWRCESRCNFLRGQWDRVKNPLVSRRNRSKQAWLRGSLNLFLDTLWAVALVLSLGKLPGSKVEARPEVLLLADPSLSRCF